MTPASPKSRADTQIGKSLSLHGCHNIDTELVKQLNVDSWHIPDLVAPHGTGSPREFVGAIEIDPSFK